MQLIQAFKQYYSRFDQLSINNLDHFYHEDLVFVDPVHEITGRHEVKQYFVAMCGNLISCRFEFIADTITDSDVWLKWIMRYQHPRLNKGELLALTGVTHLVLTTTPEGVRIRRHEDFYDMGSMLYEHVPVLGLGVRHLKQKLASNT